MPRFVSNYPALGQPVKFDKDTKSLESTRKWNPKLNPVRDGIT